MGEKEEDNIWKRIIYGGGEYMSEENIWARREKYTRGGYMSEENKSGEYIEEDNIRR